MSNEAKSLRWLADMFPYIENPKDDAEKMNNAIHIYATNGADKIEQLEENISMMIDNMR